MERANTSAIFSGDTGHEAILPKGRETSFSRNIMHELIAIKHESAPLQDDPYALDSQKNNGGMPGVLLTEKGLPKKDLGIKAASFFTHLFVPIVSLLALAIGAVAFGIDLLHTGDVISAAVFGAKIGILGGIFSGIFSFLLLALAVRIMWGIVKGIFG